ncbi:hypothetical protein [Coralliovum pocilloporae]|uniref:hypothetical protein n=1 Tax=Coralliovum pocilloporae TaxID=3066369 RepID=UPI0033072B47
MSVETTTPEDVEGKLDLPPSYYRIFIAAIAADGKLVYLDQDSEDGPFTGTFTQLTDKSYDHAPLQAGLSMDGYVTILAQQTGTQHLIYIRESNDEANTNRFDQPVDLGLPPSVAAFQDTKLIRGLNGLDNIFGTAATTDNSIWWKFKNPYTIKTETEQVTPPGSDTPIEVTVQVPVPPAQPWSDWIQIPGGLKSITAVNNADGRLIIGGLNSGKIPYINFQNSDDPFTVEGWKGWEDISGVIGQFEQIELAIDGNALVHIFGRIGTNIYMKAQKEVGKDDFTGWVLFAAFDEIIYTFDVDACSNDGLYITAQVGSGSGSPIYGWHQADPNLRTWTAPQIITFAQSDAQLVLEPNANTKLSLFALNTGSQMLDYTDQLLPDYWQAGWKRIGQGITSIAITHDITPNTK